MGKEFTEEMPLWLHTANTSVLYTKAFKKYSGNHHIAERDYSGCLFHTAYIQCGSESKTADKNMDAYVGECDDELYKENRKREVPLAEITMSEDRYPNSLIR